MDCGGAMDGEYVRKNLSEFGTIRQHTSIDLRVKLLKRLFHVKALPDYRKNVV